MLAPSSTAARWRTAAVVLAAALVVALTALAAVVVTERRGYAEDSPEVGFARDMYVHHDQAVVMSLLVRERGTDADVAQLARDVVTGQAEQQGVMLGWLQARGVPATTTVPPMGWMGGSTGPGGHEPHDMGAMSPPTAAEAGEAPGAGAAGAGGSRAAAYEAMGMATDEELSELGRLSGPAADLLYAQLMQEHHRGAVEMAQAFLELSDEPQLSALAEGVVTSQERELRLLADLEQRLAGQAAAG